MVMLTIRKLFEQWMEKEFDEPDWDEGWNRAHMVKAFEAGFKAGKKAKK